MVNDTASSPTLLTTQSPRGVYVYSDGFNRQLMSTRKNPTSEA